MTEPGFVAETAPGPGDGFGFGSGSEDEFGPETEPGAEVGPVAESETGSEPVLEMELVIGGRGTAVEPWIGVGPGLGPGPGTRFGFETEPEVDFEKGTELGPAEFVAEAELGPVLGLVLGPGGVEFVGLDHKAEPESVYRFGLGAGFGAVAGTV